MRIVRVVFVMLWASFLLAPAHADEALIFNTASSAPLNNEPQSGFLNLIFAEIGARLERDIEVIGLPAERAISNANAGKSDGEAYRIGGMQALYPNLIPVPEIVSIMKFSAFSRDQSIPITDWNSLGGLNVAYIRGWKIFEANVPKSAHVTIVRSRDQLFSLLQSKRIDVALFDAWQGAAYTQQRGIRKSVILSQPLATKDMFLYLHSRHADLVGDFTKALQDIITDGTYQRLYDRTIAPLENP